MATSSIVKKVVITKRSEARRLIKALEDAKNDVKVRKAKTSSKDIKGKDVANFFERKHKPNKNLHSTEHWAIYIANKCFDDGYQIGNFKLQFLLYFIYKHFKDKNIRIFYDDVKGTDWVCNQGFPKFFNAYYRFGCFGVMGIPFKLKETVDLTDSAFCSEVDDIVKRYRAKDIYVLETLFKEAESIKEKDEIVRKRVKNNETKFNYDKEHDLLYVSLKNCPNHYVDQLEDKYFDLWRDSETYEIVGAHIWNASEWLRTILKTAEEHSIQKTVKK